MDSVLIRFEQEYRFGGAAWAVDEAAMHCAGHGLSYPPWLEAAVAEQAAQRAARKEPTERREKRAHKAARSAALLAAAQYLGDAPTYKVAARALDWLKAPGEHTEAYLQQAGLSFTENAVALRAWWLNNADHFPEPDWQLYAALRKDEF